MTKEEFNSKVMDLMNQLREAKEKSSVLSHELREFGGNLEILGRVMRGDLLDIEVRTDSPDLWFVDKDNNVQKEIASGQLENLHNELKEYQYNEAKIKELEKCLKGAGYGNIIKG